MPAYVSRTLLGLCVTSTLLLSGCQSLASVSTPATTPIVTTPEQIRPVQQFNIQGKIGVKTPQQSGSAFFSWVQQENNFDIELSGILGIGKTQIQSREGQVTLHSAKTGLIQAQSPEDLLEQATGWQTPITHLIQWVQAKPATLQAQLSKDEQQRIVQIIEDGWTVNLSYSNNDTQPYKLVLRQPIDINQENRITMIIQNRG